MKERVTTIVQQQVTSVVQQQVTSIVQQQVTSIVQEQVTAILEKQLSSFQMSSPNPSYADVARTPPGSHPSNLRTISDQTTPSTLTDTLYCAVDVSNAGSATVNPINPEMVALGPTFCRSLPVEASVIENRKIRVYLHVYSDSNVDYIKISKHL